MGTKIAVVTAVFICREAGQPMVEVAWVEAFPSQGLVGPDFPDRYYSQAGTWSSAGKIRDASFLSSDALTRRNRRHQANFEPGDTRRNFIVSGIDDLLGLVGVRFMVGGVEFLGTKDCAPCSLPSKRSGKLSPSFEVVMENRGGLRAQISTRGFIAPGAEIIIP